LHIPCVPHYIILYIHTFLGHIPENEDECLKYMFVCNLNNCYYHTHSAQSFLSFFNHVNSSILNPLLHIYDISSHYCIFLCSVPPWGWPKKAKTCRRFTTFLYILVSNYSAVVGIYMVTYLTARNMDNFKSYMKFYVLKILLTCDIV
jgi:hypothetical protein